MRSAASERDGQRRAGRLGETSVLSAPVPSAREYDVSARNFTELADMLLG